MSSDMKSINLVEKYYGKQDFLYPAGKHINGNSRKKHKFNKS